MFPEKYELWFYIPEDDILHSHCREHLKYYLLAPWPLVSERTIPTDDRHLST
jgi:hypothetical protein